MKRFLGPLLLGILWTSPVWAAQYFEFSPDYSESLLVASSETVIEVFLPLNEYLSGTDFWMSNASTAGDAVFTLMNPSGAEVSTRTVSLPPIADTPGGTRVHVNWTGQLSVAGASPYRVRISTAAPTLRLYYAATNRIIAHNAPPAAVYASGVANIGGEDKGFGFTYALHENSETTPPQITNTQVSQPGLGQAYITFNANEPVDARVVHTTGTVAYSGQYSSCIGGLAVCTVYLAVTPGLEYTYTLTAKDVWGNETSVAGTFSSLGSPPTTTPTPSGSAPTPTPSGPPPPDTTKPTITNLRATNITTDSVTVAWTTNEASNGLVVVQLLPFLISAGGGSDSTLELEHAITVGDIGSDALYMARVTTSDASGNSTIATISFSTLAVTPTPPAGGATPTPTPSPSAAATPTPTVSVGPGNGGGETAQWSPPTGGTPSDGYRVDIIGSDGKLIRTIRTNDTSVGLGDIPDGATIVVYADNGGVYEKVATPATIRRSSLLERLITALPYVLGGVVLVIAIIVGVLKFRERRKILPPPAAPPAPHSGAMPNPSAF